MALRRGDLDLLASRSDDFDPEGQSTFGFFKDYDYKEHHSGHGGHHYNYYDDDKCCPLVVDFLCLVAVLFSLTVATLTLNQVIILEIMGRRRRKRGAVPDPPLVFGGERNETAVNDGVAFLSLDVGTENN